jgi:hypothetical protein
LALSVGAPAPSKQAHAPVLPTEWTILHQLTFADFWRALTMMGISGL